MTDIAAIPNRGYHAHIYYDPAKTRPTAERLCAVIGEKFKVEFGASATNRWDRTRSPTRRSSSSPSSFSPSSSG
jgi:aromatic ring-cleaving dioxygenase